MKPPGVLLGVLSNTVGAGLMGLPSMVRLLGMAFGDAYLLGSSVLFLSFSVDSIMRACLHSCTRKSMDSAVISMLTAWILSSASRGQENERKHNS